ncbi:MAG: DnaJ domain-containing protein [Chlorobi bacterium]|nr:DnaJ domain-containing protein [Chlorobiota bacterium]
MAKFGKWISAGLGWAFFGPIGGILGFAIGSMFDGAEQRPITDKTGTTTGGYAMSLLVLVAAVMKADGKVLKSELDYVKKYFIQSFGSDAASEAMIMLRDILKQQIPLNDVSRQIKQNVDYSGRLQLLHFLFGIAAADGVIHPFELKTIEIISKNLGISQNDYNSIKSMFYDDVDSSYKILNIDKTASNEEIKKAYRKMAIKYHPDKVSYLGKEFQEKANEKFQKVNEAYEKIKKERGFV